MLTTIVIKSKLLLCDKPKPKIPCLSIIIDASNFSLDCGFCVCAPFCVFIFIYIYILNTQNYIKYSKLY